MKAKKGKIINSTKEINDILKSSKTIAVVGLSPKPQRDSHRVADYMQKSGYKIIPVRPAQKEILGEPAYKTLDLVPGPVDIVNVFRKSEQIMPHVDEAIKTGCKVFWMQLGIENMEAAEKLLDHGINVIMNRCIMVDHDDIFRKKILF